MSVVNNGELDMRLLIDRYNKLGHSFIMNNIIKSIENCYNRSYICEKCKSKLAIYLHYINIDNGGSTQQYSDGTLVLNYYGPTIHVKDLKILTCNELIIKSIIE